MSEVDICHYEVYKGMGIGAVAFYVTVTCLCLLLIQSQIFIGPSVLHLILKRIIKEETSVNTPIKIIALSIFIKSAIIPVSMAPMA